MSETPVTRPARQKLSFTLAEEESMVAKTVAVDPHLSDGSVEFGKVPPSQCHGRIDKPLSKMLQVGRSASDQENDALQSNPKPTETLLDAFSPVMSEWSMHARSVRMAGESWTLRHVCAKSSHRE